MIYNNKGQAFEAYKLLIAFIVAAAILGIILTMVNQTNNQALIISNQKIEDGFLSAINSPIISMEKPFVVKDVLITGFINSSRFEQLGNIEPGCFGFITGPGAKKQDFGVEIESRRLRTDVYFVCGLSGMDTSLISYEIWPGNQSIGAPFNQDPASNCENLFCVMYINRIPGAN